MRLKWSYIIEWPNLQLNLNCLQPAQCTPRDSCTHFWFLLNQLELDCIYNSTRIRSRYFFPFESDGKWSWKMIVWFCRKPYIDLSGWTKTLPLIYLNSFRNFWKLFFLTFELISKLNNLQNVKHLWQVVQLRRK